VEEKDMDEKEYYQKVDKFMKMQQKLMSSNKWKS